MRYGRWKHLAARLAEAEDGRLPLWQPVFFALGIAFYFALPDEPTRAVGLWLPAMLCAMAALASLFVRQGAILLLAALCAAGFAAAKLRTDLVAAPVLSGKGGVYTVEGRISAVSRLPGGEQRLVLAELAIERLATDATPARIRITSRFKGEPPPTGARIRLKALLRPPPGPARPDGYDFARKAWFERIGAVGFAISAPEILVAPKEQRWRERIETLRSHIARQIRDAASGPGAEVCVALIIGEQQGIDEATMKVIRVAGIAHILSISGAHMTLVAGTIYWLLRALLALSESLALRFDIRKGAALAAILTAAGYYLISGMGVATLRSFIMISIVFLAIFLARPALSLRNVAVAALLVLAFSPESLVDVSFQMSFAAVTALIAFYESHTLRRPFVSATFLPLRLAGTALHGLAAIVLTTLAAGLAVLPFGVFHFNHISTYSVLGNLLAMPVLSLFVMPLALIGMALMPFGLSALPLALMAQGTAFIIWLADWVAQLAASDLSIGSIGLAPMLLFVGGGLWLALWRSRLRFAGLVVLLVGFMLAPMHPRPFLLVDREGKNVALIDERGRLWPGLPRAGGFSLAEWRRAYATDEEPEAAEAPDEAASPWRCDEEGCTALHAGRRIALSLQPSALDEDCRRAQVLVALYPVPRRQPPCSRLEAVIDIRDLKRDGAHAVYVDHDRLYTSSSGAFRGRRPWSQQR